MSVDSLSSPTVPGSCIMAYSARFVLLVVLIALPNHFAHGADNEPKPPAKKAKGKFTVGKDTTYVTGPLDKDGYIDYPAALNERLGKGVTPENNANVLIWKALGPRPEGGASM